MNRNHKKHQMKVYIFIYIEKDINVIINIDIYHLIHDLLNIALLLC